MADTQQPTVHITLTFCIFFSSPTAFYPILLLDLESVKPQHENIFISADCLCIIFIPSCGESIGY